MFPGQNHPDAHENAQDKAGDETKAGGISRGPIGQIKNARRLIPVHALGNTRHPIISTAIGPPRKGEAGRRAAPADFFWAGAALRNSNSPTGDSRRGVHRGDRPGGHPADHPAGPNDGGVCPGCSGRGSIHGDDATNAPAPKPSPIRYPNTFRLDSTGDHRSRC
ncbi:MAG: hypothetical protein QOD12_2321 [Verrucomicrobiota bacterium]